VDERPIANQAFCKDRVMIGGRISRKRKTKLHYWGLDQKETVDAIAYSSALDDVVLDVMDNAYGYGKWRFLHDPSHTANITKNHLAANDMKVLMHPTYSPDLNPIEQVWNWLKSRVMKKQYHSIDELIRGIEAAWADLSLEMMGRYINNHIKTMVKIRENNGKYRD